MNEIHLWGKKVLLDKSPVVFTYNPGADWLEHWEVLSGEWKCEDGCLIGSERKSTAALIVSKKDFGRDIMFSFTIQAVPPATRDLNALFYTQVNEQRNWIGESYVCGLNGWYEHRSGIERDEADGTVSLYTSTALYKYVKGTEVRMDVGCINGHSFMMVDGEMVTELQDPHPLNPGKVGFSAYCTMLRIKDIEVRELYWEDFPQEYEPEF